MYILSHMQIIRYKLQYLSENLPSILGAERPGVSLSKTNPLMAPSSHLAQTINTSATGELVILKSTAIAISYRDCICIPL